MPTLNSAFIPFPEWPFADDTFDCITSLLTFYIYSYLLQISQQNIKGDELKPSLPTKVWYCVHLLTWATILGLMYNGTVLNVWRMKIDDRETGRQRKREVEILNQTGFLKELSFISVQEWTRASQVKNLRANSRDAGSIPGSGRFPGERNGNPLQYACLENPMRKSQRLQSMRSRKSRTGFSD